MNGSLRVKVLWALAVAAPLSLAPAARADEDYAARSEVIRSIREGRRDDARDRLDAAIRAASAANKPLRLGRLELFRAELEADRPTETTVDSAKRASLHLADAPEAQLATVRYHVSGAQVALTTARLGAAALHVQEGRAAIAKLPMPAADAKIDIGSTDLRKDLVRLDDAERALFEALRDLVGKHPSDVPGSTQAALVAIGSGKPIAVPAQGEDPDAPKSHPSWDSLKGKIDKALATAEEAGIAAAEKRGDGKAAAVARTHHAETLLRLGKKDDALTTRRAALAYFRDKGTVDQVLAEEDWIADKLDKDHKAQLQARRDAVMDVERYLSSLAGPARAAAHEKFRGEYVAWVDALAAATSKGGKSGKGGKPDADAMALGSDILDAVDLAGERSVWQEARLLSDPDRWQRAGTQAADLRKALDAAVRSRRAPVEDSDTSTESNTVPPATAARQRVTDALVKGDARTAPSPIDVAKLGERLAGRTLLVYARLDMERVAIAALAPGGAPKLSIAKLSRDDEKRLAASMRSGLWEGGESWRDSAVTLYDALFSPVESLLGGKSTVVVPDGAMAAVPLNALLDKKGRYLGERAPITLVPSLRSLVTPRPAEVKDAPSMILGISRFADGSPQLPTVDKEIASVRSSLEGASRKVKLGSPGWNAAQFVAEAGPFDAVHIHTRAHLDGEQPLLGTLSLATSAVASYQLGAAAMKANLVVLDTPSDAAPQGSPFGAARAETALATSVLIGTAPSMILALSPEAGPATAALFSRFYERWAGGESPAVALAGAQKDMREQKLEQAVLHQAGADPLADGPKFAHPRYWACFAAWGD